MMVWQSGSKEQVQNDWETRSAKERNELSRSIEETLADNTLLHASFADEEDESVLVNQNSIIIPPKLSLQSKPLPVVLVDATDVSSETSKPATVAVSDPPLTQKKRRLAGRSTKVQLKAVPKSEKKSSDKTTTGAGKDSLAAEPEKQLQEKNSKRQPLSERGSATKKKVDGEISRSLAGSCLINRGQRDVMVTNSHVSLSSVVIVTLLEDAGPVVVKYISLHPQIGFTVHFSDYVELDARFNYVILMGELF